VLQLKSSFLSALLDWAVTFVPNFSSSNLLGLFDFLDFRSQLVVTSLIYFLCTWAFLSNKLLFIYIYIYIFCFCIQLMIHNYVDVANFL
jgi:hypothetical protein